MDFVKRNIKFIIIIIIIIVITGGISVYATSEYMASLIIYKNDVSIANALDDLYSKLPNGTIPITTKDNQIDVSAYQYADTTEMYTSSEYTDYGTQRYNEGYTEGRNSVGGYEVVKTGSYTSSSISVSSNTGAWTKIDIPLGQTYSNVYFYITSYKSNSQSNHYLNFNNQSALLNNVSKKSVWILNNGSSAGTITINYIILRAR